MSGSDNTALTISSLGKCYQIASHPPRLDLRETIVQCGKTALKSLRGHAATRTTQDDVYWALQDVSFNVQRGECVGVIGRNGAGKSTLLKILSRITEPTSGSATLHGRVASLLEVGTGFHPDLSGRENVVVNGAILGMPSAVVRRRMDDIIAFAGVERFIDMPVKRYSSGMYVRLAFAVAAHMDPEILIVDEVLAVGDAQFQQKCIGLMQRYASEGRTILFVSHNMASVRNLCQRAVCLEQGRVHAIGATAEVINAYLALGVRASQTTLAERKDRSGNGLIRLLSVELLDAAGDRPQLAAVAGESCTLRIRYARSPGCRPGTSFSLEVGLDDPYGQRLAHLSNVTLNQALKVCPAEAGYVDICLTDLPLRSGVYGMTLYAIVGVEIADWIREAASLQVVDGDFFHSGRLPPEGQGTILLRHTYVSGVDC